MAKYSEETENNFFKQIVNDAKKELKKKHGTAYLFSMDQVECLKEYYPNLEVKYEDHIYYVRLTES